MSEARDDDEDLEPAPFILMQAEETFDGQERVMSRAAYDLQVRATVHSASCGHPGYVPDDYLEHLDGLGIETTITAAELCAIGTWERVDGGYRVLDWESVEYALDAVRQRTGEDPNAWTCMRIMVKLNARTARVVVVDCRGSDGYTCFESFPERGLKGTPPGLLGQGQRPLLMRCASSCTPPERECQEGNVGDQSQMVT